jgi:NCAIR mutase (PurE)-related protein
MDAFIMRYLAVKEFTKTKTKTKTKIDTVNCGCSICKEAIVRSEKISNQMYSAIKQFRQSKENNAFFAKLDAAERRTNQDSRDNREFENYLNQINRIGVKSKK